MKYSDYSMTCLERFQLQQDQLDSIRECSIALTAMVQEGLDLGVSGRDCADALESLLLLIPKE